MSEAKATKAPNYTADQEAILAREYKAGSTIESIAATVGKTTRSVIAKLSRMDVGYKAKTYVRKDGAPVQKKDDTATAIGAVLRLNENDTDSLAKANRAALAAVWAAISMSKPITGDDTPTAE